MNGISPSRLEPRLATPPVASSHSPATGFADLMRVSFDSAAGAAGSREQQAKMAANQLVSVAFIKPLLAQMHQSPFKSEMFHGGQGESMFQEHLDTVIADRISARMNLSLGEAIYRQIAGTSNLKPEFASPGQTGRIDQHG